MDLLLLLAIKYTNSIKGFSANHSLNSFNFAPKQKCWNNPISFLVPAIQTFDPKIQQLLQILIIADSPWVYHNALNFTVPEQFHNP
jgi:hypothetical protein